MKSCIKRFAVVMILATAVMGLISCSTDPEIKYVEKEVEKTVYVCPKCEKTYNTAKAAADCCGVQTVEKEVTVYKYVCPKDKKEYATAQEAADCCGVQIEYVDKEVEKIVKKYVCPRDGKEYDTAEEAENCCGPIEIEKPVEVIKYVCPKDKKEYTTAEEAADCCGVQYETVKKYVCPRDGKEYDTVEEAENCCGPIEIEKPVEVIKYVCPKDKKEYTTAQEAADCCGVQTIEKEVTVYKYVCPKDKKEYATAQEAADCCGVQIEYVDKEVEKIVKKYVCPRDGKEYDTAEEAENCCGPVEVEKLVYISAVKAGTYTVYHFQQKTTGGKAVSDYVLESTENSKSVAAESTIAELKKTYEGFTEKAMAQNETAIYVFYDRNKITYTFQTGTEGKFEDGKTEKTVSGLYGASYTKPKAPTSGDYNFVKWQDASENAAPSVFGAEDKTWTAVWKDKSEGGAPDYSICVVGDFILKDGTILSKDESPESGTVAAVIVRAAADGKPALGVGVVHSNMTWCTSSVVGHHTNITDLQGDKTSGYMDGSDGWSKLTAVCSDAQEHPEYYPAWKYCLDYATTNGLTEDLANGWYLPTVAELYTIYQNKTAVDTSLSKAGGSQFGTSYYSYWSCCQENPPFDAYARGLDFSNGNMSDLIYKLNDYLYVCSVRAFN